jgi:hypothetical protein
MKLGLLGESVFACFEGFTKGFSMADWLTEKLLKGPLRSWLLQADGFSPMKSRFLLEFCLL